jgi:YVTN family beta-propeller protein
MDSDGIPRKRILLNNFGTAAIVFLMLISIAGAAPFAYITNGAENGNVSVIDTATNNVTTTIPGRD